MELKPKHHPECERDIHRAPCCCGLDELREKAEKWEQENEPLRQQRVREETAHIAERGWYGNKRVERYRANRCVCFFLNRGREGAVDLNDLWRWMQQSGSIRETEEGRWEGPGLEDLKEFYRLIGYSVDGFAEVFGE